MQLLPDAVPAVRVFSAAQTQWRRAGIGGHATGLDYAALPALMGFCGIDPADQPDVFGGVQILEAEALTIFREQSEQCRGH